MIPAVRTFQSKLARHVRSPGDLCICVIVGGARAALTHYPEIMGAHVEVEADADRELDDEHRNQARSQKVHVIRFAVGETADTLFKTADLGRRELISRLAPMEAAAGSGQLRGAGAQSAETSLDSPEAARIATQIRDEVLIACGGAPRRLRIIIVGSMAGGMCAGAALAVGKWLLFVLAPLHVVIDLVFDLLGPITFTGLGDRLGKNAAATLVETLDFLCQRNGDAWGRVVTSLRLVELPPVRHDAQTRDQYVLAELEAIESAEMAAFLRPIAPNDALEGPLGNVQPRQVSFMHFLDPRTIVAPQVATVLVARLKEAVERAIVDPTLVQRIEFHEDTVPKSREAIDAVVERASSSSIGDLLASIERPAVLRHVELTAHLSAGQEYQLRNIEPYFASTPDCLEEAHQRLVVLRSLDALLRSELAGVMQQVVALLAERDALAARVRASHATLQNQRRWFNWKGPASNKLRALHAAAAALRDTVDELAPSLALQSALELAVSDVRNEEQHLTNRLDRTLAAIDRFRARGTLETQPAYVLVRDANQAFAEVLDLQSRNEEDQIRILCRQAQCVTVAGLAQITGADPVRLDAIARQIVHGTYEVDGPPFGGHTTTRTTRTAYVLPPMLPEVADELRRLVQQFARNAVVLVADSIAAGVTVVRYRFSRAASVEELFSGYLRQELREAYSSPLAPLYFPRGFDCLERFGLLHDGMIRFRDESDDGLTDHHRNGKGVQLPDSSPLPNGDYQAMHQEQRP